MIRFPAFEQLGVSVAAISDRSDGDCRSSDDGAAGREAFCARLGVGAEDLILARQVHGVGVARAVDTDRGRGIIPGFKAFPDTDAILTDVPRLPLGVTVADCVPVWLFDPLTQSGGLVHAGRAGTFRNAVGAALTALNNAYGAEPGNVHALIGPSAGPNAYEVSEEIAEEFEKAGYPVHGRLLDLWKTNAMQLEGAGVPRSQIDVCGICTMTDGRFHSHRAHANGMRNLALLVL